MVIKTLQYNLFCINPRKFKIDSTELNTRVNFIQETKREVQFMKDKISESKKENSSKQQTQSEDSPLKMPQAVTGNSSNTRYSRLVNEADSPSNEFVGQTLAQQELIIGQQNEQLEQLASSMGTLKTMSRQIGHEVDEQAVMLDDFGHEMEHTQSKMENTLGKIARVMRLTNDRRQWAAICALSGILAVVIVLFFVL
ncbi:Syntaxin-6 [Armadillidium nasatum]|uniref:Syntaxin-6 n=1 Tax=Armadillidium nasatum TaxID=96803 RepID=A0A5N5SZQ1_9CRUS|nr:Syntaxin-6 [Armadillidium nasatum]